MKQSGLGDRFWLNGNDLSGDIGSLQRIGGGPNPLDLTDITQSGYDREGGLRTGALEFTSWFNPARAHPVLAALPRTDVIGTYGRGAAIGAPAASCRAVQVNYDGARGQDGAFSFGVSLQSDGFGIE